MTVDEPTSLAEKLSWFLDSLSSIEIRNRIDVKNNEGARGWIEETYIETALGRRFYETTTPEAVTGGTARFAYYFDGRRFAEASWSSARQESVIYTKAFGLEEHVPSCSRPYPLNLLYPQQRPLTEALSRAESLGQERRIGRDCDVVVLKDLKWTFTPVDIVYSLDRETALPLAVRCFDAGADFSRDKPQWFWEAKSFDRVEEGRYWPMRSVESLFAPAEGGGKEPLATRDIRVVSISFNKEYPESVFQPNPEPGTAVLDTITGERSTIPGEPAYLAKSSEATSAPVLATRPADWTVTASTAGLVVGLSLVGASLLLWWRQRWA